MIRSGSWSRGITRSSERRKSATPTCEHPRVERPAMPGTRMNARATTAELAAPLHLGLQRLKTAHRAGDRILRATQVVAHDLEELTGAFNDPGDERGNVGAVEVDLRGPDRRQSVVGAAQLVAWHDVVHLRAAVKRRLSWLPAGRCPSRRPARCTHRPSGRQAIAPSTKAPCSRISGDLGDGHRRHRDLGELRQEQHAVGVVVMHAAGDDAGRVARPRVSTEKPVCHG